MGMLCVYNDIFVPPYVIGGAIIFCPVVTIFFPRLISAAGDWMSTVLLHMVWS